MLVLKFENNFLGKKWHSKKTYEKLSKHQLELPHPYYMYVFSLAHQEVSKAKYVNITAQLEFTDYQ